VCPLLAVGFTFAVGFWRFVLLSFRQDAVEATVFEKSQSAKNIIREAVKGNMLFNQFRCESL
jgi:hypothetical protein